MILVPSIDLRGGRVVRLVQGDPGRETGYGTDPLGAAAAFAAAGARLLHVVDLDAALGLGTNRAAVAAVAALCRDAGLPVQVGGGLRTLEDVDAVLALGAARAVLGTAAARDPDLVRAAVRRHGERIVVAADARGGRVMVDGWRRDAGPLEGIVRALERSGAPRFLVTAIAVDGTLAGPDLELYRRLASLTDRPVLASGGVGSLADLHALAAAGVEGAVVGRALHDGRIRLEDALALEGVS